MIQKEVEVPVTHEVSLSISKDGKLTCQPASVEVRPGDVIVWKWREEQDFPFGLVIKSPFTPLVQHHYVTSIERGFSRSLRPGCWIAHRREHILTWQLPSLTASYWWKTRSLSSVHRQTGAGNLSRLNCPFV